MKKYKAYLKQSGEGCDYTIGCAQTVVGFLAENMESAHLRLKEIIMDEYTGERQLDSANIYEVTEEVSVNLETLYAEYNEMQRAAAQGYKLQKEREEYERLKNKFE
jgi:hypothetical protein